MSHPSLIVRFVAPVLLLCTGALVAQDGAAALVAPASAAAPLPPRRKWTPPVEAPIVDTFRPAATPYGRGNWGLDYDTVPGTPVQAVGAGRVAFAGQVGGQRYVTINHPGGLRTSLSWLDSISVVRGDHVDRGQLIGTAGERLQLGLRRGDRYLDPAILFRSGRARLVLPPGSPPSDAPR